MAQFFLSRAMLILLSATLATLAVACKEDRRPTVLSSKQQPALLDKTVANPTTTTVSPAVSPTSSIQQSSKLNPSSFEQGLDKATSAFSISQSAQSIEDWNLVASQFQEAIAFLKAVPANSPDFPHAQTKIAEFQHQLKYAQQQATRIFIPQPQAQTDPKGVVVAVPQVLPKPKLTRRSSTPECGNFHVVQNLNKCSAREYCSTVLAKKHNCVSLSRKDTQSSITVFPSSEQLNQQLVFVAPIKRHVGGTPIISVTFNGNQQFDMILDTGASGTVITQKMADALGVMPVGKAKANTASSKAVEFPIGYIDSMEVGGARVNQVAVAIAGSDLETGLLGHDFFGNYDLTIKRDVVEFRPQTKSPNSSIDIEPANPKFTKERNSVEFP
jgi:predicted aspartyl protease